MEQLIIPGIIIGVIIVLISCFAIVSVGGKKDDEVRWANLLKEMNERYPDATYKAKLEFMRRNRYAAIKIATQEDDDIVGLTDEYQLIIDEQERIEEGERQLGAEFNPYVANITTERN